MTVLIAGGDSFTYGSELPSQEHSWANLLAERKGWNICNVAKPAASNSAIRRNVMNAVNKYIDLDLYVIVMWSFPNRYEFRFTYDTGQVDSPWYSINPWTHNDQNFELFMRNWIMMKQKGKVIDRLFDYWISNKTSNIKK